MLTLSPNLRVHCRRACLLWFFAILSSALLLSGQHGSVAYCESSGAVLFATPPMFIAHGVGEFFNLSINVSNVQGLRCVRFALTYDPSLLDVVEVAQGCFFPSYPESCFGFEDDSLGAVRVNMSLADSEAPRSGNGTLASIRFKAVRSFELCGSPVELHEILLLDSSLVPISFDSVGALYFWESIKTDPPGEERLIDVYTHRGGVGPNMSGGEFQCGEEVHLISVVTYSGLPVQSKLVAYEVLNPLGEVVMVEVDATDHEGFAGATFRIPQVPSSDGIWTVFSTVDVAEVVVWDTVTFRVYCLVPVGGHSTLTRSYRIEEPLALYLTLVLVVASVFTVLRRRHSAPRDFSLFPTKANKTAKRTHAH